MTYPHTWIEVPATNRDYCLCGASSERHPQGRMLIGGLALGDCTLAMRSRLSTLESAPTFADGVRAGLEAAKAAVSTCCEAAYADIERIDPSTVKP